MAQINASDIQDMVSHWLNTPTNGYLGSSYGQDAKALLQNPQAAGIADEYLKKLRADVSILSALPAGSVNLYGIPTAPDRLDLIIEVAGQPFPVGDG